MATAICVNARTGNRFCAGLLRRLDGLPSRRMLEARGIDARRYLHSRNLTELERQLRECEACA